MAPPVKQSRAKLPSLKNSVMVDTINGKLRVRKWPVKRGQPKSEQVRIQNDRFASAQRLAKTAPFQLVNRLIDATKGTGLYPRDLLTQMILAGRFEVEFPDGTVLQHGRATLEPVMFQGFELRLETNWGLPAGGLHYPPWPTPIQNPQGMWSASAPTLVTIPAGVTTVSFFGGGQSTSSFEESFLLGLEKIGSPSLFPVTQSAWFANAASWASGPLRVNAGEQYRAFFSCQGARTMIASRTYFGGVILGAN